MSNIIVSENNRILRSGSSEPFSGVKVNSPLTGNGTSESALGLLPYISWGGNGTTSTFSRSGTRVLDDNNNSAYYLASGLNLNNESITDSAISSWNDARTTVETNSANWGGITSVDTNNGITGDGTTSLPIGLSTAFQLLNSQLNSTASFNGSDISIVGLSPRIQLKTNNSSYNTLGEGGITITHSASGVGGGVSTSHYGERFYLNYNDGDYYLHTMDTTKSGLGVAYKASPNVKAYYNYSGVALTNDNGATNEYVNVASIRIWNSAYNMLTALSAEFTAYTANHQ